MDVIPRFNHFVHSKILSSLNLNLRPNFFSHFRHANHSLKTCYKKTALFFTISNEFIFRYESHATDEYSKKGLQRVLYAINLVLMSA